MPLHTGLAHLSGATEDEVQEAVSIASSVGRESLYLNGIDYDHGRFMRELQQIADHVSKAAS